jgi:hypothetical protein
LSKISLIVFGILLYITDVKLSMYDIVRLFLRLVMENSIILGVVLVSSMNRIDNAGVICDSLDLKCIFCLF